jgi:tetratricopeptide (TPR) repeat protein
MSRDYLKIIVVILVSFLVHSNSFRNEFVIDDPLHISENQLIKDWKNVPLIFTRDYFYLSGERAYFPVVTLSYFLDYSLWGLNVFGYHLTNTLFHSLNSVLIYLIFGLLLQESKVAFLSSILFAIHPIHTESLNFISGRTDLLAMFFFLLSFYLYIKTFYYSTLQQVQGLSLPKTISPFHHFTYFFSCISFILALFSKEMAVTLPLVLVLSDFCFRRFNPEVMDIVHKYLVYVLLAFLFILGRFTVFEPVGIVEGCDLSSPVEYIGKSFSFTFYTMVRAISYYLKLLILPTKLTAGYVFPHSLIFSEPAVVTAFVFLLVLLLSALFLYRREKVFSFSIFYFFLTLLPVANIVPFGRIFQERYLYIPSLGFCIFLALLMAKTLNYAKAQKRSLRFGVYFCIFSVLGLYSLRTVNRNFDWKNNLSIWLKALQVYPNSEEALVYAGIEYQKIGEIDKAIDYYERGLLVGPDYANTTAYAENNLGLIEMSRNNYEKAISHFKKAREALPGFTTPRMNLAGVYVREGYFQQAINEYEEILSIDPNFEDARRGLAMVYFALGDHQKGQEIIEKIKKKKI